MSDRYDNDYRNRDSGGKKILGLTALVLVAGFLIFLAYMTYYNSPDRDRLEVNNFEITPQEESVGESAVREAPTVINLPDPEFNMPALPAPATPDNQVNTPAEQEDRAQADVEADTELDTRVRTDDADVNVGVN